MAKTDFIVKCETFVGMFSEKLFRCEKEQQNTHTTEDTAVASTFQLLRPEQLKTCMIYGVLFAAVHPTHRCVTVPYCLQSPATMMSETEVAAALPS